MDYRKTLRRTGWIVLLGTFGVFLPGEGSVGAACQQNCRNAGFLGNQFWSVLRNPNMTMTVFRNGFIFNPQPQMGKTTHLPALEVLNGQVFLAVRGDDPNGGVWTNRWTGSSWTGWANPQQGATTNSPDMSVFNNSVHLVVAGIDPNKGLWLNRYTSAWLGYIIMGGSFTSSQTCASSSLRIGGCRTDGQCWRLTTTNLVTWTPLAVGDPCP